MSPLVIEGPPGGGKTDSVIQAAREAGVGHIHIHGPTMPAEDFGVPMPVPVDGSLEFFLPLKKFPFVGDDTHPEFGIIHIDEVAGMNNDQQKVIANMMQEYELHGRKIKPGWMNNCTGNRQEDRAGANRILSHLNDRYITIAYEMKTDDWLEWAQTLGGVRAGGDLVHHVADRPAGPDLRSQPAEERHPAWLGGAGQPGAGVHPGKRQRCTR